MKFNLNELNTIVKGERASHLETQMPTMRGADRLTANKEISDIKRVIARFRSEELG